MFLFDRYFVLDVSNLIGNIYVGQSKCLCMLLSHHVADIGLFSNELIELFGEIHYFSLDGLSPLMEIFPVYCKPVFKVAVTLMLLKHEIHVFSLPDQFCSLD